MTSLWKIEKFHFYFCVYKSLPIVKLITINNSKKEKEYKYCHSLCNIYYLTLYDLYYLSRDSNFVKNYYLTITITELEKQPGERSC